MGNFFNSLRFRIVFYIFCLLFLITILSSMMSFSRERKNQEIVNLQRVILLGKVASDLISRGDQDPKTLLGIIESIRYEGTLRKIMVLEGNLNCLASTVPLDMGRNFNQELLKGGFRKNQSQTYSIHPGEVSGERVLIFPILQNFIPLGYVVFNFFLPEFTLKNQVQELPIFLANTLTLFLGFLLSWIISELILIPIEKLTRATQKVASGDFSEEIILEGDEKLNSLAFHFNSMASQIKGYISELKEKNLQLEDRILEISSLYEMTTGSVKSLDFEESSRLFIDSMGQHFLADFCYLKWERFSEAIPGEIFKTWGDNGIQLEEIGPFIEDLRNEVVLKTAENKGVHLLFIPLHTALKSLGFVLLGRRSQPMAEREKRFAWTLSGFYGQLLLNISLFSETKYMGGYIQNVINSLKEGVMSIDLEGRVTTANGAFFEIMETPRIYNFPMGLSEILKKVKGDALQKKLGKLFFDYPMPGEKLEVKLNFSDTHFKTITYDYFPLLNAEGDFLGKVFVLEDITEKKKIESDFAQNEKLVTLGRMAASINHEIGNALTPIKSLTQVIKSRLEDPETREYLGVILKELEKLEKLLRSLKQFSKKINLEEEKVNLPSYFSRLKILIENELNKNGIKLIMEEGPLKIWNFDPQKIQQTLINLVSNSLDSMVEAEVKNPTIQISFGFPGANDSMIIKLADNGPGIPNEKKEEIFEAFFTTKSKGTGLGLSISRQILRLHGGELSVVPHPLGGGGFLLEFPRKNFHSDMISSQGS